MNKKILFDFISGALIGVFSIFSAYMILRATVDIRVASSASTFNVLNAVIVVLIYGLLNVAIGLVFGIIKKSMEK